MPLFRSRLVHAFFALVSLAATVLPAHAQPQVLRVTAIPDESPTELARKAA
ncbi:MAG: putative selenate ABC transporter substrate-binding protein, partial [Comamonadaceae bacterium]